MAGPFTCYAYGMAQTTTDQSPLAATAYKQAADKMQRITVADDEMIRNAVRLTGRKRQALVNDALASGMGLVLLHAQDSRAARAILDEVQQRLQILHVSALADAVAPKA